MYSTIKSRLYCRVNQRSWKKHFPLSEWFDILSLSGKIIGRAPREICHRGPNLLHAVVHLHLINSKGQIYLQKRSIRKKIQPGKWDTSVGGHIDAGEVIEAALFRETREELAIEGFTPEKISSYLWQCPQEVEWVNSFWTLWSGDDPKVDPEEIDEGRWWSGEQIEANQEVFTPNFLHEWNTFLKSMDFNNPQNNS